MNNKFSRGNVVVERRKYRFRAWDQTQRAIYPVVMVGRGVVMLQDGLSERTARLANVTIMQYSGLQDIRGNEIYEGDDLELNHDHTTVRKRVVLQNGSFRLVDAGGSDAGPKLLNHSVITRTKAHVVGNAYSKKLTKDFTAT